MKSFITFFQAMLLSSLLGIIVIGLFLLSNISQIQKIKKAEFFYTMTHDFFILDSNNRAIIRDLGEETPILKENGGKYDVYNIDDYLAQFDQMKIYLDEGLVSEKDLYDSYSYYIVQAYQNKEIWKYVTDLRKEEKDSTFYANVEFLAKKFIEENKNHTFSSH